MKRKAKKQTIPVIFRVGEGGDVIAIFPTIPADIHGEYCQSYEHIGQHGACSPGVISRTRRVKRGEHLDLIRELRVIGYDNLIMRERFHHTDYAKRIQAISQQRFQAEMKAVG